MVAAEFAGRCAADDEAGLSGVVVVEGRGAAGAG